jgi:4'-phosphopantetheinyl transferase
MHFDTGAYQNAESRLCIRRSDIFPSCVQCLQALAAPIPAISLWLCQLDRDDVEFATLASYLSTAEHHRAARFGTEVLRRRWITGRACLRAALGVALGVAATRVKLRRGMRGRPELDSSSSYPDFNISHTGDVALIAVGSGLATHERIGVDLEYGHREVAADRLARKFLGERERAAIAALHSDARRRAFLRLWTCKEAMSKATGDALSAPFRELDVDIAGAPRLRAGPPPYLPEDWRLLVPEVAPTLIATLAIWARPARSATASGKAP